MWNDEAADLCSFVLEAIVTVRMVSFLATIGNGDDDVES